MRERILLSATRLFAERGFDGTALQDIADLVGIRKPSLLHHFRSKDELRLAVLDDLLSRWKNVVPAILVAAQGGRRRFEAVFETVTRFFLDDPARARVLLREVLDRPKEIRALVRTHLRPWIGMVGDYIRQGQNERTIRDDLDPNAYIAQMLHLIIGSIAVQETLGAAVESGSDSLEATARQVRELTRIARTALFRDRAEPPAPPRSRTSRGRKTAGKKR